MCLKPENLVLKDRDGNPFYVWFNAGHIALAHNSNALGNVVLDDMAQIIATHKGMGQYIEWRGGWEKLPGEAEDE